MLLKKSKTLIKARGLTRHDAAGDMGNAADGTGNMALARGEQNAPINVPVYRLHIVVS